MSSRSRIHHRYDVNNFLRRLLRFSSMLTTLFACVRLTLTLGCLHRNVYAIYNGVNILQSVGRWRRHRYTAMQSAQYLDGLDWWFWCSSWCLTVPWPPRTLRRHHTEDIKRQKLFAICFFFLFFHLFSSAFISFSWLRHRACSSKWKRDERPLEFRALAHIVLNELFTISFIAPPPNIVCLLSLCCARTKYFHLDCERKRRRRNKKKEKKKIEKTIYHFV